MKKHVRVLGVATAALLILAGCGDKPADEGEGGNGGDGGDGGEDFLACLVLDTGGVTDKSFNQSAWEGAQAAADENPNISVEYTPSQSDTDYEPNLRNSATSKGCSAVIAAGGLLGATTEKIAKEIPDVNFALIDDSVTEPKKGANLYTLSFKNEQPGFLAGYVAASVTKTGKVGTWGGIDVGPQVTGYMDGYLQGVEYYNEQKDKDVQVLGWDGKDGTFVGSFTDSGAGRSLTEAQVQQGADVVFPVAGGAGGGALTAADAAGGKLKVVWVDFPGCEYYPDSCDNIPTSALKNIPELVKNYILKTAEGSAPTGHYVGTLENGGVGIEETNLTPEMKDVLNEISGEITDNSIPIKVN